MDKIYVEGHWIRDFSRLGSYFVPSGYYDIAISMDTTDYKFLTDTEMRLIVPHLEEGGFIKPRLDERLRVEDLKITHRLLDLLEKK